ncbi:efflux transporter outer membrane subunit [Legionella quateirensis]|uniref:Outer membrane efflux protein n=1 Tax=Legionella quateirensis TaxID=45072 RepID=A0A378KV05_9GAMM|nr:efflux transporter outer membrane subunit [Legionella quateirensis]KTD43684.1 outer membrane efflux protein [Legionella quateirensis]STY17327.1 outer membrane efflux protein [Legionella quateirensis]
MNKIIILGIVIFIVTSCSFAPKYERPFMPVPAHFKETGTWVPAKTKMPSSKVTPWWEVYNDPVLNKLERLIEVSNQDLKKIFFRYQEALALVQVSRAAFFPNIQGTLNANRQQTSTTMADPSTIPLYNNYIIGSRVNYELDAWGSISNAVAAQQDTAHATEAELAAISLSLHAELASDYFSLRGCDESQRILDATVVAYQKALYLNKKRYHGGASPIEAVDQAETQLENAKTAAADMRLKRAQYEHAIAILIGQFPADFSLPPAKLSRTLVKVAPDLPSTLLERRPDIAAAEFRVQAANATIGVARAAFFPVLDLTGILGFQSQSLSNLISKPSLIWSLGPISTLALAQPLVAQPIFEGGKLVGQLKYAKASYFETVADYRQTVLTAFQEVEDSLVAVNQLDQEIRSQKAAAQAAKRALTQANNRYSGGIVTFLDVVVVENTALQTELAAVNVLTRRQIASVQLIKALGGSWVHVNKVH